MGKSLAFLSGTASIFLVCTNAAHAASLTYVSDVISTSVPGTTTVSHTLQFTAGSAIPASGKIVITPESGAFTIPAGFDYTDVDVAASSGGPLVDRAVASIASASEDGISVQTGAGSRLTITLNSTTGISAGNIVQIELGSAATYGVAGDTNLTNPASETSYRIHIETRDQFDVALDSAKAMIAIVQPVSGGVDIFASPPLRSNGLPSGELEAGNSNIEISLNTDEQATCHYATTTGILYDNMPGVFTTGASSTIFHTTISGHQDDTTYNYYVRCMDSDGNRNTDDYLISFSLKETPEYETSVTASYAGPGGVGQYPSGSAYLYYAQVTLTGFSSPQSTIRVLKDGVQQGTAQAGGSGSFTVALQNLERGAYTFFAYATDRAGRISSGFTSTLSLAQGTNNAITNIVIPPTIALSTDSTDVGEDVRVFGEGVPGATVELAVGDTRKFTATTTQASGNSSGGLWELSFSTRDFSRGTYRVRARVISSKGSSGYSKILNLGVGAEPSTDLAERSDMNGDDAVNLVDFSIMLTKWGTDDPDADINSDGIVNLADFSILLFNWTG